MYVSIRILGRYGKIGNVIFVIYLFTIVQIQIINKH